MLSIIKTCCINGMEAADINVEIDLSNGLPVMNLVGLPDQEVKESRERVRAAINNSGLSFPLKRITINLAPADTKKEGTHFDLPIALGILMASGQVREYNLTGTIILGELSLDGRVQRINGVLPMLLAMFERGFSRVIVPKENLEEAKLVVGLKCIGISSLNELVAFIKGDISLEMVEGSMKSFDSASDYLEDFRDISGQENLKRGMEIAAAGGHNLLMVGPPGSGKTMAARRLPSILPTLTFEEAIEITKIYSVAGILNHREGMIQKRPFRSPHHTTSTIAITGGGRIPRPGEVSLSHYGVLFLDELPEFSKTTLEVLRQPIEDGFVSLSRVNGSYTYPSKFMLIAAANPCPCGFYGTNGGKECTCTPQQIRRYMGKISGPLLDRIDLVIETSAVTYGELATGQKNEDSRAIRKRVEAANLIQRNRYRKSKILNNSQLSPSGIKKYCSLEPEAKTLMEQAFNRMNLSARGYNRILKVSRTIADLEGSKGIELNHVSEALQYRNMRNAL